MEIALVSLMFVSICTVTIYRNENKRLNSQVEALRLINRELRGR